MLTCSAQDKWPPTCVSWRTGKLDAHQDAAVNITRIKIGYANAVQQPLINKKIPRINFNTSAEGHNMRQMRNDKNCRRNLYICQHTRCSISLLIAGMTKTHFDLHKKVNADNGLAISTLQKIQKQVRGDVMWRRLTRYQACWQAPARTHHSI